jgi:uncharacterized protein (DUF433 family)
VSHEEHAELVRLRVRDDVDDAAAAGWMNPDRQAVRKVTNLLASPGPTATCGRSPCSRVYPEGVERKATVIQIDPEVLSGTPVFAGTRVPIETLLAYLERGQSLADFVADFPSVTEEQAIAALQEAKEALLARAQRPVRSAANLLNSWLDEDSKIQGGLESWEELRQNLDRDRPSSRPLFP